MEKLKRYDKYKDSGVAWLGEIPEHWDMIKTKYLFKERIEKGYPDEPLLAATQTKGVVPKSMYENRTVVAQKDLHLLKLVDVGDFVISLRSFQGGIEYAYFRGIISPAYTVMIPKSQILHSYYKHLAKSKVFIALLQTCVTGIREGQNINYEILKNIPIPVPPLSEQQLIASYLDWQTTKINKFISGKKKLITLLKEQVELLSFGNSPVNQISIYKEWKKLFPHHWKFEKGKRIFTETNIKNNTSKELLAVTQDKGILLKNMCAQNYVSPSGSLAGLKLVQINDFVISLRSFQGGIECSEYEGIVSPAYTIMKMKKEYDIEQLRVFYRVLFKSENFINLLNTIISGIRDGKNISFCDFSKLEIPVPPLSELDDLMLLFKRLKYFKKHADEEVTLIQEYRTRLISDVVTGKVDVRSIEVPEFEQVEMDAEVEEGEENEEVDCLEGVEE